MLCLALPLFLLSVLTSHPIPKWLSRLPSHTLSSLSVLGWTQVFCVLDSAQVLSHKSSESRNDFALIRGPMSPPRLLFLQHSIPAALSLVSSDSFLDTGKTSLSFYLFLFFFFLSFYLFFFFWCY